MDASTKTTEIPLLDSLLEQPCDDETLDALDDVSLEDRIEQYVRLRCIPLVLRALATTVATHGRHPRSPPTVATHGRHPRSPPAPETTTYHTIPYTTTYHGY
jgi:hypothetical protein